MLSEATILFHRLRPQPDQRPRDRDVHSNSTLIIDDTSKLEDSAFGECVGTIFDVGASLQGQKL